MTDPIQAFARECQERVASYKDNEELQAAKVAFNTASNKAQYSYNFKWMGRPIIQYPQDMIAMQELIWEIQPDLIIETGIAHGGSLIYYASLLELIGKGEVLGIDIDIRSHNRTEIEKHPMFKRIHMIEGSSIEQGTLDKVLPYTRDKAKVLVVLDSNHTHEHVLEELRLYAPLVTTGSYIVVFDTIVQELPDNYIPHLKRPWGTGDNPMTAVDAFLAENSQFAIDEAIDHKILISVAPRGYLKKVK